jgi:hypothetical protein
MGDAMDAVYYGDILDDKDILNIGLLLSEFKDGKITYADFQYRMRNYGLELSVKLIDSSRIKLLRAYNEFNERVANNTILDKDIDKFIVEDKNGLKFQFSYDRKMIEVLADAGDAHAIDILESLRRVEQKYSGRSLSKFGGKK